MGNGKNDFCESAVRGAIGLLKGNSSGVCPVQNFKFSELCEKEVINICDGCRMGYVCDLLTDAVCGKIEALILPLPHKLFEKCKYRQIKWEQVERIGKDMIIVSVPKENK